MTSLEAAQLFADGSLDFVYIDASHEYEDVKADIQAWLPKMKRNAILSGDDFDIYQGVNKAVEELLPGFELIGVNWMYRT
jgi:predicted O-methyltransferase YrrM